MAKIDDVVAHAFCECVDVQTTDTVVTPRGKDVLLWGHRIAYEDGLGNIVVDHCGYHTRTTMNRLHAILQRYTDGRVGCGLRGGVAEFRYSDGTTEPFIDATTIKQYSRS